MPQENDSPVEDSLVDNSSEKNSSEDDLKLWIRTGPNYDGIQVGAAGRAPRREKVWRLIAVLYGFFLSSLGIILYNSSFMPHMPGAWRLLDICWISAIILPGLLSLYVLIWHLLGRYRD